MPRIDQSWEWKEKWKANQKKQLTNEGLLKVAYVVTDPDLPDAKASGKDVLYLSNLPETFDKTLVDEVERVATPYATLEENFWPLDGSKVIVPALKSKLKYSGYISGSICNDKGEFGENPVVISMEFGDEEVAGPLPGLTITWGKAHGEYPDKFKVTIYKAKGASQSKEFTNETGTESIALFEMANFNRVEIEILKWHNKYRRARIEKVFMGIRKIYLKDKLMKFSCSHTVDPISTSLPKYEISFDIDNRNGDFNPQNKDGLSKYMMERQEIRTEYGYRLENSEVWIPGGVYYLSEWSAPQNGSSASFKARDLLGFLNKTYYKGKFQATEVSLYDLAENVIKEADLPNQKSEEELWLFSKSLEGFKTTAPLPMCSLGECLQLIANAACCVIYFDGNGRLNIRPLEEMDKMENTSYDSIIDAKHSYSKPEITLLKPLKQVDVSVFSWNPESTAKTEGSAAVNEDKELYKSDLSLKKGLNTFIIEYSDMANGVTAKIIDKDDKVITNGNATIDQVNSKFYAKSCELIVEYNGKGDPKCRVLLTGKIMKETKTTFSINNPDGTFNQDNSKNGEIQPLANSLITKEEDARRVGKWLYDYLNNRERASLNWRVDPCVDALDTVKIGEDHSDNKMNMRTTTVGVDFTGAFKGKIEGVVIK